MDLSQARRLARLPLCQLARSFRLSAAAVSKMASHTLLWWRAVDTPDLAPGSSFPAAALAPLLRAWRSLRDQPAVLASDILGAAARAGLVSRPDSSIRFSRHASGASRHSCTPEVSPAVSAKPVEAADAVSL